MSYHIITPDPYEDNVHKHTANDLPPTGHEQRGVIKTVIIEVAIAIIAVFLLLRILASNNTFLQTTKASRATKPAPVHKVSHLNKFTVDLSYYDPSVDLRDVTAHSVKNGYRTIENYRI